eukprot:1389320-Amorphochlora_amoeboformis.AAC.1
MSRTLTNKAVNFVSWSCGITLALAFMTAVGPRMLGWHRRATRILISCPICAEVDMTRYLFQAMQNYGINRVIQFTYPEWDMWKSSKDIGLREHVVKIRCLASVRLVGASAL